MANNRHEWDAATLAELDWVHDRSSRWQFALGCAKVALFRPATFWPGYSLDPFWRLGRSAARGCARHDADYDALQFMDTLDNAVILMFFGQTEGP